MCGEGLVFNPLLPKGRSDGTALGERSCWLKLRVHIKHSRPVAQRTAQELRESRGGRPGLSVLTSLLVSVDVKLY